MGFFFFGTGFEFFSSGFSQMAFGEYEMVVNFLNVDLFLKKEKKKTHGAGKKRLDEKETYIHFLNC